MNRREIEAIIAETFEGEGYRATGWQRIACPACEAEGHTGRKNLAVKPATGGYKCFRCEISGVVRSMRDSGEVLLAAEELGVTEREKRWELPAPWFQLTGEDTDPMRREAWEFLLSRGLTPERILATGAGVTRSHKPHVILPAWGWRDRLAGWVTRYIGEAGAFKYVYPPGFSRNEFYNAERLRVDDPNSVAILSEGVLDALAVHDDGVALWGKGTHETAPLVAAAIPPGTPVVVALDGDAWKQGLILAADLKAAGVRAVATRLPPGEDLSSLLRGGKLWTPRLAQRLRRLVEAGSPLVDSFFSKSINVFGRG